MVVSSKRDVFEAYVFATGVVGDTSPTPKIRRPAVTGGVRFRRELLFALGLTACGSEPLASMTNVGSGAFAEDAGYFDGATDTPSLVDASAEDAGPELLWPSDRPLVLTGSAAEPWGEGLGKASGAKDSVKPRGEGLSEATAANDSGKP